MKYDLHLFDQACYEANPDLFNEAVFHQLTIKVKENAYENRSEGTIQLYIRGHQTVLWNFRASPYCGKWADELLYFIETHFTEHLDVRKPISSKGRINALAEHDEALQRVKKRAPLYLSEALVAAMEPLLHFCEGAPATHHEVRFLKQCCLAWQEDNEAALQDEELMIQFLLFMNYNSGRFFHYLQQRLRAHYQNESCPRHQSEILAELNVQYGTYISEHIGFLVGQANIGKQLAEWIATEIAACHKRMELHDLEPPAQTEPKTKLHSHFSSWELTMLFKGFKDEGLIKGKLDKDIPQMIVETFHTPKMDTLSFPSVLKKFYSDNPVVRASLTLKLTKLMKRLRVNSQ